MRGLRSGTVVCLLVAGCGSSAHHAVGGARSTASGARSTASGARSTASSPRSTANGEISRSPQRIASDVAAALAGARSLRIDASLPRMRLILVADSPTRYDLTFAQGSQSFEIRSVASRFYLRANHAFWRTQSRAASQLLADRWLLIPASLQRSLTAPVNQLTPAALARCMREGPSGRLTVTRRATVDGMPTVVVHDDGNAPGDAPGDVYVATVGPPYPLRIVQTGRTRPGGHVDACNDGKGGDDRGVISLSDFNRAPVVVAPGNALSIPIPGQSTL